VEEHSNPEGKTKLVLPSGLLCSLPFGGWQFDFQHLYRKSGSVARYYDFAADLRALVARQTLPGYQLGIEYVSGISSPLLTFRPVPSTARG